MSISPALSAIVAGASCLAVLGAGAQTAGDAIGLRGYAPGAPLSACPKGFQRATVIPGKRNFVCGQANSTIGGATAQMFSIEVFEGKIVRVGAYKIAGDGLNDLSEALALKFGTPKVSNKTKSTLTADWSRGGVDMRFDVRPEGATLIAVDVARYDRYSDLITAVRRAKNKSDL